MAWQYRKQQPRVRGNSLGPSSLLAMGVNSEALFRALLREHKADGQHNALEIPRAVGSFISAGSYTATGFQSSRVTLASGHNPAVGTVIGTYASGFEFDASCLVMTNVRASAAANKPYTVGVAMGATAFTTYSKILEDPLGAGDTWGVSAPSLDVAVFAGAQSGLTSNFLPLDREKIFPFASLTRENGGFNFLAEYVARWRAGFLAQHDGNGLHSTEIVSKAWVSMSWNGSAYVNDGGFNFNNVNRIGVGHARVGWIGGFSSSTTMRPFVQTMGVGQVIAHAVPNTDKLVDVYLYGFDGTNWNRIDGGFFISAYEVA
jgi:hypothetical protein